MTSLAATLGPAVRTSAGRARDALFAVGACGSLAAIAAANGGYFPTSWGWSMLVFAWISLVALVAAGACEVSVEGAVMLIGTFALTAWTFGSAIWSWDAGQSVLEGERTLVVLTAVSTLLLVARGRTHVLLGSVLAAVTGVCAYSLATRVFPAEVGRFDTTAGYRLFTPIGYWNSLGVFGVIGVLLAVGFVARARTLAARGSAAAALVVLAPTVYFTFSRGSLLALGLALAFLLALDPRRLQASLAIVAAAPAPVAAVVVAWHSQALVTVGASAEAATTDGRRLALAILALMPVAATLAVSFGLAERWYAPGRHVRTAYSAVLVAALVVAIAAASARWGSPATIGERMWHGFAAAPRSSGANLNERLFQFSSNGRLELWRAALREYRTAPLVGSGAGTFQIWWYEHRPTSEQVVDAHSLYLETMAELGLVGLAALVTMLGAPLVGAWRTRRRPLVPFAAAAFLAWVVHAGVDWDWEITAVTLAALACAVAAVSGEGFRPIRLSTSRRGVAATLATAVAAFAVVVTIGNRALAEAHGALVRGDRPAAYADAQRAARWMPWSVEPQILVGELDVARGRRAAGLDTLRQAVAKTPRSYIAWYALAGAATGAERRHAALEVISLNPHSDEASIVRGILAKRS
jgi:O-antigen ligase